MQQAVTKLLSFYFILEALILMNTSYFSSEGNIRRKKTTTASYSPYKSTMTGSVTIQLSKPVFFYVNVVTGIIRQLNHDQATGLTPLGQIITSVLNHSGLWTLSGGFSLHN